MLSQADQSIINQALGILSSLHKREGLVVESPNSIKDYCRLALGAFEHEVFAVLFLDSQHRLIKFKEMFRGTVDGTSVYPREVVKEALSFNAAAVVFTHNHPSGICEPSQADINITNSLVKALGYVDVRVLDHLIVSCGSQTVSLAERGLL